ncbi:MAG TPA: PqiC family protein [Acetobacteraceae bacterium]|nr:PqiC family protein [Acetobacteraceae bacterium]
MGGAPAVIRIREISIARYLDRPQIVRGADANQLDVRANELWGEPLGAMLSRVLAEELAQRLPHSMVFGEHGAVSPTADATVLISVEQLDADGPGAVALVAHTSVSFKNGSSQPVLATVRVRIPGDTVATSSEVAAMSTAVGQLADRIAETLRTGGAGT